MSLRNDITKGLHSALQDLRVGAGYDIHFEETADLIVNLADLSRHRTPLLEIIDGGEEEKLVETSSGQLYMWNLILRGSSRIRPEHIHEELNKIVSALKQWCFSVTPSTIHTSVVDVKWLGITASGLIDDTEYAAVETNVRLLYYAVGDY